MGYHRAVVRAATVRKALDFLWEFAPNGFGVLPSSWTVQDGQYVMEVYDWCDCWFDGPHPVVATIVAPQGFSPEDDPFAGVS